jgi:hypothetical protein
MPVGGYYPYYIAASYGTKRDVDPNLFSGFEHALDVSLPVALGAYFTTNATQRTALGNVAKQLLITHDQSIAYWTKEGDDTIALGRSRYRTDPPWKFGWQYKNSNAIGWALDGKGTY